MKKKIDLKAVAAEIVGNLNGQDTGELTALQCAKEDEIERVLKRRGIKRTDEVDEALMDLIGYADPFQTEDEARLYGAAAKALSFIKTGLDRGWFASTCATPTDAASCPRCRAWDVIHMVNGKEASK